MNGTVPENQTSSYLITCKAYEPAFSFGVDVLALDFIVLLPIQICVIWFGVRNCRLKGRLTFSEIFTMNLSAIEVFAIVFYSALMASFEFNFQDFLVLLMLYSGSFLVGRPVMNSLICVERFIAVAHPLIYRNPAFVKHRYVACFVVWMLIVAYGVLTFYNYPHSSIEVYIFSLSVSISVIASCSILVLKILLRPSPGETQKESMDRQKKRAFVIIAVILVCISVPYSIDVLLLIHKKYLPHDTFCQLMKINLWLMRPSSAVQSVVYLSKQRKSTRKGHP